MGIFQHKKISILFQFGYQRKKPFPPLRDDHVDLGSCVGLFDLLCPCHDIVVIVDDDQAHHTLSVLDLLTGRKQRHLIDEKQGDHVVFLFLGGNDVKIHIVDLLIERKAHRSLIALFDDILKVHPLHDISDVHIAVDVEIIPQTVGEQGVIPAHLPVLFADHHGQREGYQRTL
ncbi:hypothetical protein SDC9_153194 [bioreactor metagenome]|uniref:Uncharacterized protein n=1 Tax=bioreactor metagenome TaxID=1076179 RepID=A0A645EWX0_9ZZZZ